MKDTADYAVFEDTAPIKSLGLCIQTLANEAERSGYKPISHNAVADYHSPQTYTVTLLAKKRGGSK